MIRQALKRVAPAAAIGASVGLLFGLATARGDHGNLASLGLWVGAAFAAAVGAFLGWWLWLFWGAWSGDAAVRRYVPPGIFGLALLIFLLEQSDLQLAKRFRQDGVPTKGTVTGIFAQDHDQIGFRYAVGERSYEKRGQVPRPARSYAVGDSIRVFYLRSDPSVALAYYPDQTLLSVACLSLLGSCWLVSGAAIARFYFGHLRKSLPTTRLERAG